MSTETAGAGGVRSTLRRYPGSPRRTAGTPAAERYRATMRLALGARRYDVRHRALVMGILNRTRDSFHEPGAQFGLDALLRRAEELVADGADLLDVGGRAGGVGTEDVS